ncbi:MAG: transglycosylase SLT domain-containing protein, partial [Gammaproteobacteria bacterium]
MTLKLTLTALIVGAICIVNIYPREVKAEQNFPEATLTSSFADPSESSIWNHLRADFRINHQRSAPGVAQQRQLYLRHAYHLNLLLKRSAPYLYFITEELERRKLPAELVILPLIESAYDPYAVSRSNAAGLWQIVPGTGRSYGLAQNHWYDGRHDVYASTHAALDYLTKLNKLFKGNWTLTIAAYNTGEGNIQRAIARNRAQGKSTDFWSLRVASETRIYVQRFLAISDIIAN